jgi:hypothetical protein
MREKEERSWIDLQQEFLDFNLQLSGNETNSEEPTRSAVVTDVSEEHACYTFMVEYMIRKQQRRSESVVTCSLFGPEDWGRTFLRNVGVHYILEGNIIHSHRHNNLRSSTYTPCFFLAAQTDCPESLETKTHQDGRIKNFFWKLSKFVQLGRPCGKWGRPEDPQVLILD